MDGVWPNRDEEGRSAKLTSGGNQLGSVRNCLVANDCIGLRTGAKTTSASMHCWPKADRRKSTLIGHSGSDPTQPTDAGLRAPQSSRGLLDVAPCIEATRKLGKADRTKPRDQQSLGLAQRVLDRLIDGLLDGAIGV